MKHATVHSDPTIAAIATSPGKGGIGIIRISGDLALTILKRIFQPRHSQKSFASHKLYYGWIVNPESNNPIDEVLATYMRAPNTYTAEDVVEIQSHGNYLVLQEILRLVLTAGAQPAEAGEFTKRAFLNGRIDLTQAEAVIDLIDARTREGLSLATSQLKGRLYNKISSIRDSLVAIRGIIEVAIDFPEEDVEIINPSALKKQLTVEVQEPLTDLIASADQGKIYREGISAVILGRPNVGKSSLLNTLLQEERALVTPVPGTTRDTIEEVINIKGMPVRIVDTAGIRETEETVEELGIKRARSKVAEADLVLLMLDMSEPITSSDHHLYESIKEYKAKKIILLNKVDLAPESDFTEFDISFPDYPRIAISAKNLEGIGKLEDLIFSVITGGNEIWDPGLSGAPNLRHKSDLINALKASEKVVEGLELNLPPDLLAIELQTALDHLGYIVGVTTTEDILDMIFERFCIGK